MNNGRVNIFSPPKTCNNVFDLSDKIPIKDCTSYLNANEGIWNNTLLSKTFYSKENIQIIQNAIRNGVYLKSNKQYIVGEQSCDDIKIVMRSTFLQKSKNQPDNIQGQIRELNDIVIDYCVKNVYSSAISYVKYLRDVNTLVVPIERPVDVKENDKELIMKPWF